MRARKACLLAAGVSILAIAAGTPAPAAAQTIEGERQDNSGTIAINLYEVDEGDPAAEFGTSVSVVNPGGVAKAYAQVLCAEIETCPNPGAIEQVAKGVESGSNLILIGGLQTVQAEAEAAGQTAIANAFISAPVSQQSISSGDAANEIQVTGVLDLHATASAAATAGTALARAEIGTGVLQAATADFVASVESVNAGLIEITVAADAISTQASGLAVALMQQGYLQVASGGEQASVSFDNAGEVAIGAYAEATGQLAVASAAAFQGIDQQVAATAGATGFATATMSNSGEIAIVANADARGIDSDAPDVPTTADAVAFIARASQQLALGRGSEGGSGVVRFDNGGDFTIAAIASAEADDAAAVAIVGMGLSQLAFGFDAGSASLTNSGALTVNAQVDAAGEEFAAATAVVQGGLRQSASVFRPGSTSSVLLDNSGSVVIGAVASATAPEGVGAAIAGVGTAIYQASGADLAAEVSLENSGLVEIIADAEAVAGDTAIAIGAVAGVVYQSAGAFGTDATATAGLANSGSILVAVDAAAEGGIAANAAASIAAGVSQLAYTGRTGGADVAFSNMGAFSLSADATALAAELASASARIGGVVTQFVSAATAASAAFDNGADFSVRANAVAVADGDGASGNANVYASVAGISQEVNARLGDYSLATTPDGALLETYGLAPSGPASASMANSGTLQIVATGGALSENSPASAFALTDGVDQIARGTEAAVVLVNEGDLTIAALADASGLDAVANAQVNAIAQTAEAVELTQIALYQSSVPVALTTVAMPVGAASVSLDNLGAFNVTAMAAATGNSALAGAAVAGIGQSAAAADASAALDNSGTISISALAEVTGGRVGEGVALNSGIVQVVDSVATRTELTALPDGTEVATNRSPAGTAEVSLANSATINIGAGAAVSATGTAFASAVATAISQFAAGADVQASIDNSGSFEIAAIAEADGDIAAAYATAAGFGQIASAVAADVYQFYPRSTGTTTGTITVNAHQYSATFEGAGPVSLAFNNSGVIELTASAAADGDQGGFAGVNLYGGVQDADGADVDILFDNKGEVDLLASAVAVADTFAAASAYNNGFKQMANATLLMQNVEVALPDGRLAYIYAQVPVGPATGSIVNDGTIDITAVALAEASGGADEGTTFAPGTEGYATAYASGFGQFVWGTESAGTLANSGALTVAAQAEGSGMDGAGAVALAQTVRQGVNTLGATNVAYFSAGGAFTGQDTNLYYGGPATASVQNSGSLTAIADARAIAPGGPASAAADARALAMSAAGTNALVSFDNGGELTVAAIAEASGTTGLASAIAVGMSETFTVGTQLLTMSVVNSGSIQIGASAEAVQDNGATALAAAVAIIERGVGYEQADFSVENSGEIDVTAVASAEGGYFAGGTAFATGISQRGGSLDARFSFDNSGELNVSSGMSAIADAQTGFAGATAFAHGYTAASTDLHVEVANEGLIDVVAVATAEGASGWAWATAAGVAVAAVGGTTSAPATGVLSGIITNAGTISVAAQADGIADAVDALASTAEAVGVLLVGGAVGANVSNSGLIDVAAVVAGDEGIANATGVQVVGNGQIPMDVPDLVFTFTNDGGTIIARESDNGGTTWRRGTAIDVAEAPNASVINLFEGAIYGNIDVQDGDAINVETGATLFDGIINPDALPEGGITAADLDTGLAGEGTLNIREGGNLVLVSGNPNAGLDDGPSYVVVDRLNIGATGTLTFQLLPDNGGTQPVGSYPQIFADTANLDGTLIANVTTANGLFEDSYVWNNVIDANLLAGTFDQCALAGPYGESALLDFNCDYDSADNVDLALDRVAFSAVGGLTDNQLAVAGGLENAYDVDLIGDFGDLVAELFTLDGADLVDAYDQLSGYEYPQFLHAVRNNSFVINSLVSDQMDCAVHLRGIDECRLPEARGRVWAMGSYNQADLDSSEALIGYDATSKSGHVGGDYQFGNSRIGAFAGYRNVKVDFLSSLASGVDGKGWQVGAYGAYDVGGFYLRGIASYSSLNGDSKRQIAIGSIAAEATGEPDVNVWSVYGEAGARLGGGSSWFTPFVAIDHTAMRLKSFKEAGGLGANLAIDSRSESQSSGLLGVKWAGNWGLIIPDAKIAYRYDFNRHIAADLRFAGGGGSDFLKEETYKRGSLIAGLGLTGAFGSSVKGRLAYQGRFNSDVRDHGFNGSLTFMFGAPPRRGPPAVVTSPPPPPPPAQTCPDGAVVAAGEACPVSPPPLPPVPSSERG